jgi:hypothetical protein
MTTSRLAVSAAVAALLVPGCGRREQPPSPAPSDAAPLATPAPATTTTTTTTLPPPVWRTVRWGMTADEVLKALPGEAVRLPRPENFGQPTPGSTDVAIAAWESEGTKYRVLFGFASGGLDRIHLVAPRPTSATCEDLEKRLTSRHGPPEGREAIATSLRGEAVRWRLADQAVTLACTEQASLGFRSVTVDYTPPSS